MTEVAYRKEEPCPMCLGSGADVGRPSLGMCPACDGVGAAFFPIEPNPFDLIERLKAERDGIMATLPTEATMKAAATENAGLRSLLREIFASPGVAAWSALNPGLMERIYNSFGECKHPPQGIRMEDSRGHG